MLKPPQTTRVSDLFDRARKKKKAYQNRKQFEAAITTPRQAHCTAGYNSHRAHVLIRIPSLPSHGHVPACGPTLTTPASPAMLTRHVYTHKAYKTKSQVIHERSGQPLSTLVEKRKEWKKKTRVAPPYPYESIIHPQMILGRLMIAPYALRETRAGSRTKIKIQNNKLCASTR